jgi:hypothetical protein
MSAIKRTLVILAVLGGLAVSAAPAADAGIFFRGGPVRRVAARAVLPPYPVARRAVFGPVYRPYRAYYGGYGYGPRVYGGPGFYGPGVSVGVGIY